ncbi:MAG: lysophospholipid acyltransferase family protein [bacterium]|nr:lysophospholipid acyltransferase family protein [bacterium]
MQNRFNKIGSILGIFFLKILSHFPLFFLYILADFLYFVFYRLIKYRIKVVRNNLANSFPEKSKAELLQIEIKFYKYLADLVIETIKSFTISKRKLLKRMTFLNTIYVDQLVNDNKSAMVVMGHYGNWEWICRSAPLFIKNNIIVAYKPLTNPQFDKLLYQARIEFGVRQVPMHQLPRVLLAEKKPYLLILLADQSPSDSESSIWVEFLNQDTAVLPGIEKLAIKYKLPIYYNEVKLLKRGYYTCEFKPMIEVTENSKYSEITQLHSMRLEENIKSNPTLWLWSHKRWKLKRN